MRNTRPSALGIHNPNMFLFSKGVVVFVADDAARAKEAEAILKNFGHSNVQVSML